MSIIHEALKKSGQSDASGTDKPGAAKTRHSQVLPPLERHRARASSGWGPLFAIVVVLLVAAPAFAPFFFGSGPETSTAHSQFAIEEVPVPAAAPSTREIFRLKNIRPGAFVLSGVVYSGESSYCLINGLVLKQGDRVGEAVVESIGPDEVVLDVKGQKLTLPVVTN